MNTNIIINLRFAATHKWPDIPSIESQFYLKYLHRHVFHIQMKWDVYHDNRAIEFVDMKNKLYSSIIMIHIPFHLYMKYMAM